jgi:TATA-box binding protein (TBP) (component of TFIID and TFIIIB)
MWVAWISIKKNIKLTQKIQIQIIRISNHLSQTLHLKAIKVWWHGTFVSNVWGARWLVFYIGGIVNHQSLNFFSYSIFWSVVLILMWVAWISIKKNIKLTQKIQIQIIRISNHLSQTLHLKAIKVCSSEINV